jgi:hypothetical protein
MAQGTIRTVSERAYFLGLYQLVGFRAFPFRACVFATQFINLLLLAAIVRRLTGSRVASVGDG